MRRFTNEYSRSFRDPDPDVRDGAGGSVSRAKRSDTVVFFFSLSLSSSDPPPVDEKQRCQARGPVALDTNNPLRLTNIIFFFFGRKKMATRFFGSRSHAKKNKRRHDDVRPSGPPRERSKKRKKFLMLLPLRRTTASTRVRGIEARRSLQEGETVCAVCRGQRALYVCPQCSAAYCSSACFGSHDGKCTETFYRSQVERELKRREASGESTQATALRGRARCAEDLADASSLKRDRLEALLKGAEPTKEEMAEALAAAGRGDVVVAPWSPWWRGASATDSDVLSADASLQKKTVHEKKETEGSVLFTEAPSRAALLKRLEDHGPSPLSTRASPLLAHSVLDAVYAYARVCRDFDGDHLDSAHQAAACLVAASPVLAIDARHDSAEGALDAANHRARRAFPGTVATVHTAAFAHTATLDDLATLVCARALCAAALLDAARLAALGEAPRRIISKLRFFLSWVSHHALDDFFPRASKLCRDLSQAALPPMTTTGNNDKDTTTTTGNNDKDTTPPNIYSKNHHHPARSGGEKKNLITPI